MKKYTKVYRPYPGKKKESFRKRLWTYGLTEDDYHRLVEIQNGRCAICGDIPDRPFHIDHCHQTNAVRGLLCGNCNTGIGLFKDDPDRLREAAVYLSKFSREKEISWKSSSL